MTGEKVLEATAPEAALRGLSAPARLVDEARGFFEVVAHQPVVAIEGGDDEVAPLATRLVATASLDKKSDRALMAT